MEQGCDGIAFRIKKKRFAFTNEAHKASFLKVNIEVPQEASLKKATCFNVTQPGPEPRTLETKRVTMTFQVQLLN